MNEGGKNRDGDGNAVQAEADRSTAKGLSMTLSPQWIAALGAIGVAVISGVVSYVVVLVQTNLEREKSVIEAKMESARIFQELVNKAAESDDPSFVILALSKVFPEDEKLIVMTAMLNPNLHTASTLNAIGAAENLDDYLGTIKGIVVNATTERRRIFNQIYGDKFPKFVMEVNYEAAVRSGGDDTIIGDLTSTVRDPYDLSADLKGLISQDKRVLDNPRLRARLVRALHRNDESLMEQLLDDAADDPALFAVLVRQYSNYPDSLSDTAKDRLSDVALDYLQAKAVDPGNRRTSQEAMHLITMMQPNLNLSPNQFDLFVQLVTDFYVRLARLHRPSSIALLTLNEVTGDRTAEALYFWTLICLPKDDAEAFYSAFPTRELGIEDWDDTKPFSGDLLDQARSRLTDENKVCST